DTSGVAYSTAPVRWRGVCTKTDDFTTCSQKVVGARNFLKGVDWPAEHLRTISSLLFPDARTSPSLLLFPQDTSGVSYSTAPVRWRGVCSTTDDFTVCSRKVVGARYFLKGVERAFGQVNTIYNYRSPRDMQQHGTWCAGAAAGNAGVEVTVGGRTFGTASGMAPRARLAIYKALWMMYGVKGKGATSDLIAAAEKAVADGVDVISCSWGGLALYFQDLPYLRGLKNPGIGANSDLITAAEKAVADGVDVISCSWGGLAMYFQDLAYLQGLKWEQGTAGLWVGETRGGEGEAGSEHQVESTQPLTPTLHLPLPHPHSSHTPPTPPPPPTTAFPFITMGREYTAWLCSPWAIKPPFSQPSPTPRPPTNALPPPQHHGVGMGVHGGSHSTWQGNHLPPSRPSSPHQAPHPSPPPTTASHHSTMGREYTVVLTLGNGTTSLSTCPSTPTAHHHSPLLPTAAPWGGITRQCSPWAMEPPSQGAALAAPPPRLHLCPSCSLGVTPLWASQTIPSQPSSTSPCHAPRLPKSPPIFLLFTPIPSLLSCASLSSSQTSSLHPSPPSVPVIASHFPSHPSTPTLHCLLFNKLSFSSPCPIVSCPLALPFPFPLPLPLPFSHSHPSSMQPHSHAFCFHRLLLLHLSLPPPFHLPFFPIPSPSCQCSPTATLSAFTVSYATNAPQVAYFSSTGPPRSPLYPPALLIRDYPTNDILKPDVVGPGFQLWAAGPGKSAATAATDPPEFGYKSGTSMSTAHLAGIMALIMQNKPSWSPSQVISAITTTAYTKNKNGQQIKQADEKNANGWDYGGGHVDPTRVLDPGLTFHAAHKHFVNFLMMRDPIRAKKRFWRMGKAHPILPWNLNRASIAVTRLHGVTVVYRRMKNVFNLPSTYSVKVVPPPGFSVRVWPKKITILPGKMRGFKVTITRFLPLDAFRFGTIIWTDQYGHSVPVQLVVRSPVLPATVVESSFDYLDAPVERICGSDVPMPYAANLERLALPQVEDIVGASKRACFRSAAPVAATA
ncbi:unnamed protein product, partial [Closterium sp. NIES-53]